MTEQLPPYDGPEYARIAEHIELAYRLDPQGPACLTSDQAMRLLATIQATRDIVDELRDDCGLTHLFRADLGGT